jgi:hypothetical protein
VRICKEMIGLESELHSGAGQKGQSVNRAKGGADRDQSLNPVNLATDLVVSSTYRSRSIFFLSDFQPSQRYALAG